jgi:hypothetical protein
VMICDAGKAGEVLTNGTGFDEEGRSAGGRDGGRGKVVTIECGGLDCSRKCNCMRGGAGEVTVVPGCAGEVTVSDRGDAGTVRECVGSDEGFDGAGSDFKSAGSGLDSTGSGCDVGDSGFGGEGTGFGVACWVTISADWVIIGAE